MDSGIHAVRHMATVRLLGVDLDRGEAEAIALAVEVEADWILLDETDGRSAASRAGLRVTGILGILLRAKQRGEIVLLKPELDALRSRARFFIGVRLESEVLRLAGE
jgi:predicted nucleic acid-binding protein